MLWDSWLHAAWPHLRAGRHVVVPSELHTDVRQLGVARVAAPAGQGSNWIQSFADGSRLHVHGFADGRMVAHRDRIDPSRSPLHAVAHVVTETPTGRVAGGLGILTAALYLL